MFVVVKSNYLRPKLAHIGWVDESDGERADYYAIASWTSMLTKLDLKADICFFGNSITRGGAFEEYFVDKQVVNLGYSGDILSHMLMRVKQIEAVMPDKLFIMAGTNDIRSLAPDEIAEQYALLIDSIQRTCPQTQIYIQSILPVAKRRETKGYNNKKIAIANQHIADMAAQQGCTYIDLYALYCKDGVMPNELTKDGLHLRPEAYTTWVDAIRQYVE